MPRISVTYANEFYDKCHRYLWHLPQNYQKMGRPQGIDGHHVDAYTLWQKVADGRICQVFFYWKNIRCLL